MNFDNNISQKQLAENSFAQTEDILPNVCASLRTGDLVTMREVCHLFNRLVIGDYHTSLWMQNQPVTTKSIVELQKRKRAAGNTFTFMQALQFGLQRSKHQSHVTLSNVEFSRDAITSFTNAASRVETLRLDSATTTQDDSQEAISFDLAALKSLRKLDISGSKLNKLVVTMSSPCPMTSLSLHDTFTEGMNISHARNLTFLELSQCTGLREPPNLQNCRELETVHISHCPFLFESPDLRNLTRLRSYTIEYCPRLTTSATVQGCTALEEYMQRNCEEVRLPPDLRLLPALRSVEVYEATRLQSAPCVTGCHLLESYILNGNEEITAGPDLSRLHSLKVVVMRKLASLNIVEIIQDLPSLSSLTLEKLPSLTLPPQVRNCPNLQSISFKGCEKMQSMPQLDDSLPKLSKVKRPKHLKTQP